MIKQDCKLGVVSLCWMEIPDQNIIINLIPLVARIGSFKMLIDYTLELTPPPSPPPFPPIPPPKKKRGWRQKFSCFKIPGSTIVFIVAPVVFANTPSKFFCLHLKTNFIFFELAQIFYFFKLIFVFISLIFFLQCSFWRAHTKAEVWAMLHHEWRELASDWLNCTDKPIPCYDIQ